VAAGSTIRARTAPRAARRHLALGVPRFTGR
jgi:hypothetical protein